MPPPDNGRDVEIRIKGTLSPEGFKQATVELKGLREETTRASGAVAGAKAPVDNLKQAIVGLGQGFGITTNSTLRMAAGFASGKLAADAVAGSVQSLIGFVKGSVQEYANQEKAIAGVTSALESQGLSTPQAVQNLISIAEATAGITTHGDDALESVEALLIQVGQVGPGQMREALKATTDLATRTGDLGSAGQVVAKVYAGELGPLLKLFPGQLKETGNAAVDAAAGLKLIEQRVGGAAQRELETYAGQVKRLGNEWGETKEAFGEFLVEGLDARSGIHELAEDVTLLKDAIGLLNRGVQEFGIDAPIALGDVAKAFTLANNMIFGGATEVFRFLRDHRPDWLRSAPTPVVSSGNFPTSGELGGLERFLEGRGGGDLAAALATARKNLADLTSEQRRQIDAGVALGTSTDKIAVSARTTADVVELYKDRLQVLKAATKAAADEERKRAEAIYELQSSVRDLSLWEITQVETVLRAGKSQEDIATAYGLTKQQVRELAAAEKGLGEIRKAQEDLKKKGDAEALDAANEQAARITDITLKRLETELKAEQDAAIDIGATRAKLHDEEVARADAEMQRYFRQLEDWDRRTKQSLSNVSRSFERLAIISGGSLSATAKAFGVGVSIADQFKGSMDTIGDSVETLADGHLRIDWAGMLGAGLGMVNALIEGFSALSDYLNRQLLADVRALQDEIRTLGGTPLTAQQYFDQPGTGLFSDAEGRRGGPGVRYREALRDQEEALREQRRIEAERTKAQEMRQRNVVAVGSIFDSVLDLGDRLPDSLRGAIDEMVRMNEVSAETRDRLFGINQATDWRSLQRQAEQYGVELKSLGTDFQQGKVKDTAIELEKFLKAAVQPGSDVKAILHGMSDEISGVVNNARLSQVALPESFRPWVQQLAEAGELLDENGNKITDLSGLTFSESLTDGLQEFVDDLRQILKDMGLLKDEAKDFANDPEYLKNQGLKGSDFGVSKPHIYVADGAQTKGIPRFNREMEIVTRPGLAYLDPGDYVGMPWRQGSSSTSNAEAIGKAVAAAMSTSAGEVHVHFHGTLIDGDAVRRMTRGYIGPEFIEYVRTSGAARASLAEAQGR